jgi:hypothetical protein
MREKAQHEVPLKEQAAPHAQEEIEDATGKSPYPHRPRSRRDPGEGSQASSRRSRWPRRNLVTICPPAEAPYRHQLQSNRGGDGSISQT